VGDKVHAKIPATVGAGNCLYVVFIDLNKAFNSVSRKYLIEKLISINKLIVSAPCMKLIADTLNINFLTIGDGVYTSKRLCNQMGYAREDPSLH
jgi:hypothetical protein